MASSIVPVAVTKYPAKSNFRQLAGHKGCPSNHREFLSNSHPALEHFFALWLEIELPGKQSLSL